MVSDKLVFQLSDKKCLENTLFHEACRLNAMDRLRRAASSVGRSNSKDMATKYHNGVQCTHIVAKNKGSDSVDMMQILVHFGANVNAQEEKHGYTPLHICVLHNNHDLAEWLCGLPQINLKAESFEGKTPYHMACKMKDRKMMKILEETRAKYKLRK